MRILTIERHIRGASVALTLLPVLLGGCGMSLVGHRIGFPMSRGVPHESRDQREIRETRESAALAPREPYWPFHLAEIYAAQDSMKRAENALDDALARDDTYAPALALRSSFDYEAGRHERAIRAIEAAIAKPGAYPGGVPRELVEGLALHYDALGRDEKATEILSRAAAPRRGDAAPALVYLTLRGPAPETAGVLAESALRDRPRSAANQNNYGITRLRSADALAARKAFEKATELDPSLAGPYYNLAILEKYYLLDDAAAARWFDLYWERSQHDPDGLAAIFGKSNKKSLAQDGD